MFSYFNTMVTFARNIHPSWFYNNVTFINLLTQDKNCSYKIQHLGAKIIHDLNLDKNCDTKFMIYDYNCMVTKGCIFLKTCLDAVCFHYEINLLYRIK